MVKPKAKVRVTKVTIIRVCGKHDEDFVSTEDENCPECEEAMETAGWFAEFDCD